MVMAMASPFSLTGQTALVVGGTSGLGLAIAAALLAAGATVVVASSSESKVAEAVGTLSRGTHGDGSVDPTRSARGLVMDVLSEDSMLAGFASLPALHILVYAAGVISRGPAESVPLSEWRRVMDVNVTGAFSACQKAFPLLKAGGGCIVLISSLGAFVGLSDVTAYGVSKAGVSQLTKSLANDWAKHGIRVNAIAPGFVPTALNREALLSTPRGDAVLRATPQGRFGEASEIAGAAVYLASGAASFTTGAIIPVDGGFLCRGLP